MKTLGVFGVGRHFESDAWRLAGRDDRIALRAHSGILQNDGVNHRSDVARKISEADPVDAVAGTAVMDDGFPLEKSRARSFDGGCQVSNRARTSATIPCRDLPCYPNERKILSVVHPRRLRFLRLSQPRGGGPHQSSRPHCEKSCASKERDS